jgi:TrmH family RNA methyltransferase
VLDGVCSTGVINSLKNERIKRYRRLRKRNFRYKDRKFLVEGVQAVGQALAHENKPECVILNERGQVLLDSYSHLITGRGVPNFVVDDKVMETLTTTVTPQGIIAVSHFVHIELAELLSRSPETIIVANRVRDPGNLGNMVRIADAAGAGGMIVCRESVDIYNPKTVRSTAGSIFHIPLAIGMAANEVIHEVRRAGYTVFAAEAHEGTNIWEVEWPRRLALVMGNEAWGIPQDEGAMFDGMVRIPIKGEAESLNVSSATAVLLYEIERCRGLAESAGEDA